MIFVDVNEQICPHHHLPWLVLNWTWHDWWWSQHTASLNITAEKTADISAFASCIQTPWGSWRAKTDLVHLSESLSASNSHNLQLAQVSVWTCMIIFVLISLYYIYMASHVIACFCGAQIECRATALNKGPTPLADRTHCHGKPAWITAVRLAASSNFGINFYNCTMVLPKCGSWHGQHEPFQNPGEPGSLLVALVARFAPKWVAANPMLLSWYSSTPATIKLLTPRFDCLFSKNH